MDAKLGQSNAQKANLFSAKMCSVLTGLPKTTAVEHSSSECSEDCVAGLPERAPLRNNTLFSQIHKSLKEQRLASSRLFRSHKKRKGPSTE